MNAIYYEDIDSITVDVMEFLQIKFEALGINLTDADLDKVCDFMGEAFRDKYSCSDYRNFN